MQYFVSYEYMRRDFPRQVVLIALGVDMKGSTRNRTPIIL